jgi:hypothetical protein
MLLRDLMGSKVFFSLLTPAKSRCSFSNFSIFLLVFGRELVVVVLGLQFLLHDVNYLLKKGQLPFGNKWMLLHCSGVRDFLRGACRGGWSGARWASRAARGRAQEHHQLTWGSSSYARRSTLSAAIATGPCPRTRFASLPPRARHSSWRLLTFGGASSSHTTSIYEFDRIPKFDQYPKIPQS